MNELIAFFRNNSKWFLFIIYVVISCMLLFKHNPYQHHVYLTSANAVASGTSTCAKSMLTSMPATPRCSRR